MKDFYSDLSAKQHLELKEARELYDTVYNIAIYELKAKASKQFKRCSICREIFIELPFYRCLDCWTLLCSKCESGETNHSPHHMLHKVTTIVDLRNIHAGRRHLHNPSWRSERNRKFHEKYICKQLSYNFHFEATKGTKMPPGESETLNEIFMALVTVPCNAIPSKKGTQFTSNQTATTDGITVKEIVYGLVDKDSFCELFPSAYSNDDFLRDFFFAIYDTERDGFIDCLEFINAHINLTYTSDFKKLEIAIQTLLCVEFHEATSTFSFGEIFKNNIQIKVLLNLLRRLLYSYYDMSKLMFADSFQLQQQQQYFESKRFNEVEVDIDRRLVSDGPVSGEFMEKSHFRYNYDSNAQLTNVYNQQNLPAKLTTFFYDDAEAFKTDTRINYDPVPVDIEINADISNFHAELVEQQLSELFDGLAVSLDSEVELSNIVNWLSNNEGISGSLIACVEAALI